MFVRLDQILSKSRGKPNESGDSENSTSKDLTNQKVKTEESVETEESCFDYTILTLVLANTLMITLESSFYLDDETLTTIADINVCDIFTLAFQNPNETICCPTP